MQYCKSSNYIFSHGVLLGIETVDLSISGRNKNIMKYLKLKSLTIILIIQSFTILKAQQIKYNDDLLGKIRSAAELINGNKAIEVRYIKFA